MAEPELKRSVLLKKGMGAKFSFYRPWEERIFALKRTELNYYKGNVLKGTLSLVPDCQVRRLSVLEAENKPHAFEVDNMSGEKGSIIQLSAASAHLAEEWISLLTSLSSVAIQKAKSEKLNEVKVDSQPASTESSPRPASSPSGASKLFAPVEEQKIAITGSARFDEVKDFIRQIFDAIDDDGNGYIEKSELRSLFKKQCQEASEEEVDAAVEIEFGEEDANGDGRLDYDEYTARTLIVLFRYKGSAANQSAIEAHLNKIDPMDFAACIQRLSWRLEDAAALKEDEEEAEEEDEAPTQVVEKRVDQVEEYARKIFNCIDTDSGGTVSISELKILLARQCPDASSDEIQAATQLEFGEMGDGSGSITFDEYFSRTLVVLFHYRGNIKDMAAVNSHLESVPESDFKGSLSMMKTRLADAISIASEAAEN